MRNVIVAVAAASVLSALIVRHRQHRKVQHRPKRRIALVWIQNSLRVRDNKALRLGLSAGSDGMAVVYLWKHEGMAVGQGRCYAGRGFSASQAFEAAAVAALDHELRARGSRLIVLVAPGADQKQSVALVASLAAAIEATHVVVEDSDHGSLGFRIHGRPPDMSSDAAAELHSVLLRMTANAAQNAPTRPICGWDDLQRLLEEQRQAAAVAQAHDHDQRGDAAHGAATARPFARQEAAQRILKNHGRIVQDVTNQRPLTQVELCRISTEHANLVDALLRETVRRLLECDPDSSRSACHAMRLEQSEITVWNAAALYLIHRLHAAPSVRTVREEVQQALQTAGAPGSVTACGRDGHRLLYHADACAVLGRSRAGGGGRVLRWASFLSAAMAIEPTEPEPAPKRLPPVPYLPSDGPLACAIFRGPGVLLASTRWMQTMLSTWGPINEDAALERARQAGEAAVASADIGEFTRAGTAADETTACIARPSRLSPFLRWGVLSARDAARLGVRRRDLLWRDWSHLCWDLLAPLQRGTPVIAPLDGACLRGAQPPKQGSHNQPQQVSCSATPHGKSGREELFDATAHLATLREADAFAAWCVGQTGAPLVDAGMRQLWAEGWIPRRVRLLCACCLTEGLGLDWRLGRDWMALTLVDHDYAINEMMWQNAGLVGVDPFYVSLRWEEHGEGEQADEWPWATYVHHWETADLRWPPHLRSAALRPRPPLVEVVAAAERRRRALRTLYKAATFVGRTGVRVDRRGTEGASHDCGLVGSGEVLGIGRLLADELRSKFF